jgi:hypothetical protein
MAEKSWGWLGAVGVLLLVGYCSTNREAGNAVDAEGTEESSKVELADATSSAGTTIDGNDDTAAYGDDDAALDAMAPVGGETYSEYDARRDALGGSAGSYEGDECTVDCGGHAAGREWAIQRGVTDESECGGNSWSFREGCAAYAREQSAIEQEENSEEQ